MSESKKIKTALVSVFHKDGLDAIIRRLAEDGVEFLSTGGTRHFIEELGYKCHAVEDLTGYPSILGGRVKTLHPKVFGGILSRRELKKTVSRLLNTKSLKSTWLSSIFIRSKIQSLLEQTNSLSSKRSI